MTESAYIATEQSPDCLLCGAAGAPLHENLHDRLFGAPGEWGFLKCLECGLAWLNPRPAPADLHKVYKRYYTHSENGRSALRRKSKRALYSTVPGYDRLAPNWFWKLVGRNLALSSLMKGRALLGTMCLAGRAKGRLLDIGCGDGEFLAIMRDAGWDVTGVEPDSISAGLAARRHGFPVFRGALKEASFPDAHFDAITLSHVIEHAYDPVELLSECNRVLAASGRIVITTPNIESRGHEIFQDSWIALDPPRHLFLFSPDTLRTCCQRAGLNLQISKTSTRNARWHWIASGDISHKFRFTEHVGALLFLLEEERRIARRELAGEELVAIAERSAIPNGEVRSGRQFMRQMAQVTEA